MSDKPITRTGRWVKLALVASLAVNLAVVGAIGGALLSGKGPKAGSGKDRNVRIAAGFTPYIRALDPDVRRKLGRDLRKSESGRDRSQSVQDSYLGTLAVIEAETFDRGALEALMITQSAQFAARGSDRAMQGRSAVLDVLGEMSLEERRQYGAELRTLLQSRGKPKNR